MTRQISNLQRLQILSKRPLGRLAVFILFWSVVYNEVLGWLGMSSVQCSVVWMSYVLHSCYSWLCGAPLQSNFKMMNKALVRRECCFLNTPFRNMFRPRSTIYRAPEMRSGLSEKLTPGSFDQSRRSRRQKLPRPFDRHRPPKGQKGVRAFGHKCDESRWW